MGPAQAVVSNVEAHQQSLSRRLVAMNRQTPSQSVVQQWRRSHHHHHHCMAHVRAPTVQMVVAVAVADVVAVTHEEVKVRATEQARRVAQRLVRLRRHCFALEETRSARPRLVAQRSDGAGTCSTHHSPHPTSATAVKKTAVEG